MLNWRTPSLKALDDGKSDLQGSDGRLSVLAVGRALRQGAAWTLGAMILAACSSTPRTVSVVDRTTPAKGSGVVTQTPAPTAETPRAIDGETYVVKRGDTLYQIALDQGQDWRDIAQWSNLEDANQIRVGQVLRVRKPGSAGNGLPSDSVAQTAPVQGPPPAAVRPLGTPPPAAPATPAPAPAPTPAPSASASAVKPDAPGERVDWAWPAGGKVIENFHETRNKGLDIAGSVGDPVLAAADGKVVYSGSGLRGYGNLIILKHNNTYLSAYAHNKTMLVKEGQAVRRGQKIAELGQTDAESPRVHFEIRRQGKPVDPTGYLPSR